MDKKERLAQCMDNAVNNMNWGQVHFFMTQFGWTWASLGGVPTVSDLKDTAWSLFGNIVDDEYKCSSTGGLEVRKEDGGITIEFVAVSAYGFSDEPTPEDTPISDIPASP